MQSVLASKEQDQVIAYLGESTTKKTFSAIRNHFLFSDRTTWRILKHFKKIGLIEEDKEAEREVKSMKPLKLTNKGKTMLSLIKKNMEDIK